MSSTKSLLDSNAIWAHNFNRDHPGFFERSATKQTPHALWIGCADSRVPESVVLNVNPGVIFTHRNIANQFHPADDNAHAVLDYAIEHLNVKDVYVVGHAGCGGVDAAYEAAKLPKATKEPIDRWLQGLVDIILKHQLHLKPKEQALALIVQENIKAQVNNVRKAKAITNAETNGRPVTVHGWLYELKSGRIKVIQC